MSVPNDPSQTPEAAGDVTPQPEGTKHHSDSASGPTKAPLLPALTWSIILAAGFLAGLAGFVIGEAAPILLPASFDLPPELRRNTNSVPLEIERRRGGARDRAAALAYGGLGAVLGLALGAAGGLARRSARAAIGAGLTGLVLGGAAGAGTTLALLPSFHATRAAASDEEWNNDLALALRTHGGIWLAIGAVGGLALGLGLVGWPRVGRAIIGGMLGAALAAVIYEFAGAVFFPVAETFRPMAITPAPRLMANLAVALGVSAAALWSSSHLHLRRTGSRSDR
jgi:hypothetical protein